MEEDTVNLGGDSIPSSGGQALRKTHRELMNRAEDILVWPSGPDTKLLDLMEGMWELKDPAYRCEVLDRILRHRLLVDSLKGITDPP